MPSLFRLAVYSPAFSNLQYLLCLVPEFHAVCDSHMDKLVCLWSLVSALAVCKSTLWHIFRKDNQQLQLTGTFCITFHCCSPFDTDSWEFFNNYLHLPTCSLRCELAHDDDSIHWGPESHKQYHTYIYIYKVYITVYITQSCVYSTRGQAFPYCCGI